MCLQLITRKISLREVLLRLFQKELELGLLEVMSLNSIEFQKLTTHLTFQEDNVVFCYLTSI